MVSQHQASCCSGITRRSFLADTGMGFTGLVLGSMLFRDGVAQAAPGRAPTRGPHYPPKAKAVIWIFFCGGVSHTETFDIKPALNTYAGKSIADTPFKDALDPKKVNGRLFELNPNAQRRENEIMALQCGYKPYGQSGLLVGDWFSHVGQHADEIAVVRSLWTN